MRRRFSTRERIALYLAQDGKCAGCGVDLESGWHADHVMPYVAGGPTDVINGQAMCPACNLKKGARLMMELRPWQQEAIRRFDALQSADFLLCACPGAGKTVVGLELASRSLAERSTEQLVVMAPTDSLRDQWASEAAKRGLDLMPVRDPESDYGKPGYRGVVVTYQQMLHTGADRIRILTRRPTFVLLDEIHHLGDTASWGKAALHALEHAYRRVGLTGTPWRNKDYGPIPFVKYDEAGKVIVDSKYEYGDAVIDKVCRRVEFRAMDGKATWRELGSKVEVSLGEESRDDLVREALGYLLDPEQAWMGSLLEQAVATLDDLRKTVPDAGGLVIAGGKRQAEKITEKLARMTGRRPVLVISPDDARERVVNPKDLIDQFRESEEPWMVAVNMVSEGVDIKRLAVGVYATPKRTPLFFRQVTGRFVRIRSEDDPPSVIFIPAVQEMMDHAKEIEDELRHRLDEDIEKDRKARQEAEAGQLTLRIRSDVMTSGAELTSAILGGKELEAQRHEAAQTRCRELGIPESLAAILAPTWPDLIGAPEVTVTVPTHPSPPPRHKLEKALRDHVKILANQVDYREGRDPGDTNKELYSTFGPRAKLTVEQLEEVKDFLERRLGR